MAKKLITGAVRLGYVFLALLAWASIQPLGAAPGRQLTTEQWRADLRQMAEAIKNEHPQPFRNVDESVFEERVDRLCREIPGLSDPQIVLAMASIVALLEDGHTRLALPRTDPRLSVNPSHLGDLEEGRSAVRFANLPVQFTLFDDGLFITRTTEGQRGLLAAEVKSIGGRETRIVLNDLRQFTFVENDFAWQLYAPDRASLTEALNVVGSTVKDGTVSLQIVDRTGRERRVSLDGLKAPSDAPLVTDSVAESVRWRARMDEAKWFEVVGDKALYIQLNELEMVPEPPMSVFMNRAMTAAREAGVHRLVIDLRNSPGGSSSWNTAIVTPIIRSDFDNYGRLFVLIGRRTFSAAQKLVNELEQYTDAVFVGEPTGASPSHFGDPVRIALKNSGLTLRVSKIAWHSWQSSDFRDATGPSLAVEYTSRDYINGRDPVLEHALNYEPPEHIGRQVEEMFRKGHVQRGAIRFIRFLFDAEPAEIEQGVERLVARGNALLEQGHLKEGYFMMVLASTYYPSSPLAYLGKGRADQLRGEIAAARQAYQRVLELDPGNERAQKALARLEAHSEQRK